LVESKLQVRHIILDAAHAEAQGHAQVRQLSRPMVTKVPPDGWPFGQVTIMPASRLATLRDGPLETAQLVGVCWQRDNARHVIAAGLVSGVSEAQRVYQPVRSPARPGLLADDDFPLSMPDLY
jgi:hypothetical protein